MGNNSHSDFHGLRTSQPAISKWFANIHSFIRHAHLPGRGCTVLCPGQQS